MNLRLLSLLLLAGCAGAPESRAWPPVSELPVRDGLPDPLTTFDGARVTTKDQWVSRRRPELQALFQHYMYGHLPPASGGG
jgi:hypothetical protein